MTKIQRPVLILWVEDTLHFPPYFVVYCLHFRLFTRQLWPLPTGAFMPPSFYSPGPHQGIDKGTRSYCHNSAKSLEWMRTCGRKEATLYMGLGRWLVCCGSRPMLQIRERGKKASTVRPLRHGHGLCPHTHSRLADELGRAQ